MRLVTGKLPVPPAADGARVYLGKSKVTGREEGTTACHSVLTV